jgi:transposase
MAFIRKVRTASGATAVQIAHKSHGRITRIEHLGSAHTESELSLLLSLARQRLQGSQQSLFTESGDHGLKIGLRQSFSGLLWQCLTIQYQRLSFDQLADDHFMYLCLARLVEPTSKSDSIRVLDDLGIRGVSKSGLHRCLKRIVVEDYRGKLAKLCFAHAAQGSGITLVLYDVTTLYFEIQKEDDEGGGNHGYRRSGMSKERRLEPQIIVGLLVDQNGFPLELHSFEGNKAETKTILPVVEAFKKRHGLVGLTVVADAGMLSAKNLEDLTSAGYTYIVGSRMSKIPYAIAEYQKTKEGLADGQIITSKTDTHSQRIIYQYRERRAKLDLRNIDKQIEKAEKIISGKAVAKRTKFLAVSAGSKQIKMLNQALVNKAKALAGIKGYVTNLPRTEATNRQIIAYYHELWHVEQSFRISKNDLKARPIFHHKQEAIEAHLTIVMAALAVGRTVEKQAGMSLNQFVKTLRPLRSGVITLNGQAHLIEPEIPLTVAPLVRKMRVGH